VREVLTRVVDHVVRADRLDQVHLRRAAHTPVTDAPNAFAICTAREPTPPAAPITSTVCPGRTFPSSRTARRAVVPELGTAAACSKVRFAGFGTSLSGWVSASSANEPPSAEPITSLPGWKPVTFAPIA